MMLDMGLADFVNCQTAYPLVVTAGDGDICRHRQLLVHVAPWLHGNALWHLPAASNNVLNVLQICAMPSTFES